MIKNVKLRPDQPSIFYAGIDATEPQDTVGWGHVWSVMFGWRNLFLQLPADPSHVKRIDSNHPDLPVARVVAGDFADTCMMPLGTDGRGTAFGQKLSLAQMNANARFTQRFILCPRVSNGLIATEDPSAPVAEILYISSHAVPSGDMYGLEHNADPIFNVPLAALDAKADPQRNSFRGPKWLLLSQCNSLSSGLHNDWLTLMKPPSTLRGVLGFRSRFFDADGSLKIYRAFIRRLTEGETLVDAWINTIRATKVKETQDDFVAVCHREARNDTIEQWNNRALPAVSGRDIVLIDTTNPSGVALQEEPPPFTVFWSKVESTGSTRITPRNKGDHRMKVNDVFTITIVPPAGSQFGLFTVEVTVTLIYLRPTYIRNFDVTDMFDVIDTDPESVKGYSSFQALHLDDERRQPDPPAKPIQYGKNSWLLKLSNTHPQVQLKLRCKRLDMLEHTRDRLWLQVRRFQNATPKQFPVESVEIEF
jgi:hypothetical protein